MKTLGYLLLGGGALYFLYESGMLGSVPTAVASGTSTSPQANTSTSVSTGATTAATVSGPSLVAVQGYLQSNAAMDGNFVKMASGQFAGQYMGSVDHWNFYLAKVVPSTSGVNTNQLFTGSNIDLSQPISFSQYWGIIGPYLTHQYGMSGLGLIAHNVNPYKQGPRPYQVNQIFGANLAPTGMETYIKVRSNV